MCFSMKETLRVKTAARWFISFLFIFEELDKKESFCETEWDEKEMQ